MLYYHSIDIGFIYSHKEEAIFWFDHSLNFYIYEKIWLTGSFGKLFRKDKSEKNLFINTFFDEIQIHFGVGQGYFENRLTINDIEGKCVVDFRPLGDDKLFILTSDGFIHILKFDKDGYEYTFHSKEHLEEYFEITSNVAKDEDFIAICSQKNMHIGEIKIFKLSEDKSFLKVYSVLDLRPNENDNFVYFIKEFNMDLKFKKKVYPDENDDLSSLSSGDYGEEEEVPLVLGFQMKSDYLMIPFKLEEESIEVVNDYARIERECCHRSCFHKGAVWTIDRLGAIFQIKILEDLS